MTYRPFQRSIAAAGNFVGADGATPAGEKMCAAFAIAGGAASIVVTSTHGVTFTASTTTNETFKIFDIPAKSWTGNSGFKEIISLK